MSEKSIFCSATQYSVTPDTLVLTSSEPTLTTVTIGYHSDSEINVGTYAKNTAILRMFKSQFDIAVAAFSDGASHGISLRYESTLKKNNAIEFACPNENVPFTTGTAVVVPAPAPAVAFPATDGQ